jgi:cytochrome c-type biogenesis protein CcmH/NrfG
LSEVVASAEDIQLGIRASKEGRHNDAVELLTRAIESDNRTDVVLYHLAFSLFKVKRFSEAVRYWEELFERHSEDENVSLRIGIEMNLANARYMAAQEEVQQRHYRQAIELLNQYCDYNPGDSDAKSIVSQLDELAVDAEAVRKHLEAAAAYIEEERWSEASNEFLTICNMKKEGQN